MIDDISVSGIITEPAGSPNPAQLMTSRTDRLHIATAEWNLLLNRQPLKAPATDRSDVHLSPEINLLNNIPWGDSLQPKEPNTLCIYCQNANGIRLDQQGGEFATICELALEVQADAIALTKHNLDTSKKFSVLKLCHDAHTCNLSRSSMAIGSSPIEMMNQYKPGGTLTLS
jgi:hypothetical protein